MLTIHRSGSPLVSGPPGDLVALDPAGDGRGAWQPAPVVAASGRDRGGELGVVLQRPDLPLACHRDPVRADGDTHGPVEPAEGEGQLPISHTDGHELTGLIGRDQQRTPCFLEHAEETGRCGGTGPPYPAHHPTSRRRVSRQSRRLRSWSRRPAHRPTDSLSLSVYRRTTLLPVPPHGVNVNRALTRSLPSCLRILIPALVGLSVIVVAPAEVTSCTDVLNRDPPTGRTTSLPAPATATLAVNVPSLVFGRPRRGDPEPAARVDVLDQDRARLGAVRLPQLLTVDAVVGGEEQRPAHIGQGGGIAVVAETWVDVLDQDRARLGAVRLPQLRPVGAVVGGEEQRPAHIGQVGEARCS